MGLWGFIFACATTLTGVVALLSWRPGMQSVAMMFCISWIVSNLMRVYFYVDSSSMVVYTWIDTFQAIIIGMICLTRPTWWSHSVLVSLYGPIVTHLIFWFLKCVLEVPASNRTYVMIINILYGVQLLTLAVAAGMVVANRWWRWHIHPAIKLLTANLLVPI